MNAYTPQAGDLVRDHDGEIWFVFACEAYPDNLYGINAHYDPGLAGQPIHALETNWGPLRLEHRPT
ncbi:hypothetical protein [Nocardiopsis metallicus]|uniref:Uncharacterized protein n=1 Tax=Nocardiopsis metallicus TaxID=179819 RepID=A0A840W5R1_9ACTN|nr:hypothetical protein [Nocardiopsis metallicus]MBB5491334.1 hypothetical protein [Nocardiopsis metallicus]